MQPTPNGSGGGESVLKVAISHPMRTWADALERLLAPRWDIEVVTSHSTPSWVRHAVVNQQVDILLTHASPPANDLREVLADLFAQNPRLGVVVLSDSRDRTLLSAAIRAGVRGWVEPSASLEHLVRVLHGVARGETWFPPALMTPVLDVLLDDRESTDRNESVLSGLSAREIEVLACLVEGATRLEIADRLSLSPHTVRTHINNMLHKLDVHSTLAAVSIARQAGLPGAVRRT
jgi:DNA-binding NarL/FixJ family response regulator